MAFIKAAHIKTQVSKRSCTPFPIFPVLVQLESRARVATCTTTMLSWPYTTPKYTLPPRLQSYAYDFTLPRVATDVNVKLSLSLCVSMSLLGFSLTASLAAAGSLITLAKILFPRCDH